MNPLDAILQFVGYGIAIVLAVWVALFVVIFVDQYRNRR